MTYRFVVIYEAQADFTTATELADRVLMAEIDWLDDMLLDYQRLWVSEDQPGSLLTWKSIPSRAREHGIRVHGHFNGEPGLPDAKAARRAIAYVFRCLERVDAILLIRDMDDQTERRGGLEQARTVYSSTSRIVIGLAIPERECWAICGYDPQTPEESEKLLAAIGELGINPCLFSHELTAGKDDLATRSPKRVLAVLTESSWERQRFCWRHTFLAVLDARGQQNGLAAYLKEIKTLLVPLISGHEPRAS